MLIVRKKSGKPFKSGLITATVEATVINEQDPKKRIAYTFVEDDSCVNVSQCELVKEGA